MRANLDFGKIQTFYTKYRPNKDPFCSKGLYYRPRSLNKDPAGSTVIVLTEYTNFHFCTILIQLEIAVQPVRSLFKDLGL